MGGYLYSIREVDIYYRIVEEMSDRPKDDEMPAEIDFGKGVRGLHHIPRGAKVHDSIDHATLEILDSWRLQDATDDPAEIRGAEQELAEFKEGMNRNRMEAGERSLYPAE